MSPLLSLRVLDRTEAMRYRFLFSLREVTWKNKR